MKVQFFKTQSDLRCWFEKNSKKVKELWIGFYKKDSGKSGITYAQALDEALCFGWIDGVRKTVDEVSYTNRFTPRRSKSAWSKMNTGHAKRLIKAGLMTPAGLEEVRRAKSDGRWAKAYDSSSAATVPKDFLTELNRNKKAKAFFTTLDKKNIYSIVYRLHNAKKSETRKKWITKIIEMLTKGERFYP